MAHLAAKAFYDFAIDTKLYFNVSILNAVVAEDFPISFATSLRKRATSPTSLSSFLTTNIICYICI